MGKNKKKNRGKKEPGSEPGQPQEGAAAAAVTPPAPAAAASVRPAAETPAAAAAAVVPADSAPQAARADTGRGDDSAAAAGGGQRGDGPPGPASRGRGYTTQAQRGRGRGVGPQGGRGRGRGDGPLGGGGRGREEGDFSHMSRGIGHGGPVQRGRGRGEVSSVETPGYGRGGGGEGSSAGTGQAPVTAPVPPAQPAADGAAALQAHMAALDVAEARQAAEQLFTPAPSQKTAAKTAAVLRPPKRKTTGTMGQPIQLITNHFDFNFKTTVVYHYDVDIQPKCPKSVKRQIFSQAMREDALYSKYFPVFDGEKNMYTARPLPNLPAGRKATLTVPFAEEERPPRDFTVQVQRADNCEVDIEPIITYLHHGGTDEMPTSSVQALDIVLRHLPSMRFTPVGKSFFPEQGPRVWDIGGGCELWVGYFSSIRMGWKQARINIDVANKAFHKPQEVLQKMKEICGERFFNPARGLSPDQHRDIDKQLKQLKVEYTQPKGGKRSYRVNRMTRDSAADTTFDLDGRTISVANYFKELGRPLDFPRLPCLWVGSRAKNIYIPAEMCRIIKGQVNTSKLQADQVSKMIRQTAVPAPERLKRIQEFVNKAEFNRDPYNREFGLQVADQPTRVTGRILPPPKLLYDRSTVQPRDGVWDLRNHRFLIAQTLTKWCLLDYAQSPQQVLDNLVRNLRGSASSLGMKIEAPQHVMFRRGFRVENTNVEADLSELKKKFAPQLVLVVLPSKSQLYSAVKHAGDVVVGQLTSCVQQQTVERRMNPQTATNICQKINAKLGGSNNALDASVRPKFLENPTIIFGADVTHPPPDQPNKPSIAAVVASMDRSYHVRYGQRVLVQFPGEGRRAEEMILDLKSAVKALLLQFFRMNSRSKPERIIFFRDGVSEGQFLQVMAYELEQVREACRSLEANYQPKITFLVVQKRHHTRLFASDMRQTVGKSNNVPPGTVVDSVITHPTEIDYFLCSHQGIQGTSRPTHYHVLHDDSGFSADQLQLLTYYLCHVFSRCTRSVSNPAPSYYAHLAAYRARPHHDNYLRVSGVGDGLSQDNSVDVRNCKPADELANMYYV